MNRLLVIYVLPLAMLVSSGIYWTGPELREPEIVNVVPGQQSGFARECLDVGLVVKDAKRTARFYEAIGFQDSGTFELKSELARAIRLSDGDPVGIRLLSMGEGKSASRLKIIEASHLAPENQIPAVVSSANGMRYMTVFVSDLKAVLKRLNTNFEGIEPILQTTIDKGTSDETTIAVVPDPDGNLIEIVGTGDEHK